MANPAGMPKGRRGERVDRTAERDDAGDVSTTPVGGRLVGEHAALRVAGEVDISTGVLVHLVDDLADRDDVVGEIAIPSALFGVGRTEVDHPRVDAHRVQDADRTLVASHVVDVRPTSSSAGSARSVPRLSAGHCRGSTGEADTSAARSTTSNGDGSTSVSRPPSRTTSRPFCAVATTRRIGPSTDFGIQSHQFTPKLLTT